MPKISKNDLKRHVESHNGRLVQLINGNYNIRCGQLSRNIGKPYPGSNKWDAAQLKRAWGPGGVNIPIPESLRR